MFFLVLFLLAAIKISYLIKIIKFHERMPLHILHIFNDSFQFASESSNMQNYFRQ